MAQYDDNCDTMSGDRPVHVSQPAADSRPGTLVSGLAGQRILSAGKIGVGHQVERGNNSLIAIHTIHTSRSNLCTERQAAFF